MPSLHQDPSSPPVLPVTSERIIASIRQPLQRLHRQEPAWYQEVVATVDKLIRLGIKISAYPQATEVHEKLNAVADTVRPLDALNSIINNQLIRNTRDILSLRCDNAHATLFLALVDGWLRSCEEYVRRHRSKRFEEDILGFEEVHNELIATVTLHIGTQSYVSDNLLDLFDNLGLTKS